MTTPTETPFTRPDARAVDQLRTIQFETGIAPHALGSVLVSFGDTRVICAASIDNRVPGWMRAQKVEGGWMTAEYSMLPYSTLDRKQRDISRGKADGRTIEIQRLIGRSLRAVFDLKKLTGKTIWIDCDVLQADGGTRTASITGAYVAAQIAIQKLIAKGELAENPFTESVAAVSVGVYQNTPVLDLNYPEDKNATVDANLVMTGSGKYVEVQSSGEEATFTREELNALLDLGAKGIQEINELQNVAIAEGLKA
ncbi:MAG TPA: ribonuclease PH [Opitutae bacterium]|jgi:ribonuclease PH|nr:ribonuclease PH [Opitutae bacterium]